MLSPLLPPLSEESLTCRAHAWRIPQLDYFHYLPIFFDGLREVELPYSFIAEAGAHDMLLHGGQQKVLPVIPQLILPLKTALSTRQTPVLIRILKTLQLMVKGAGGTNPSDNLIGQALVPYYRQLLPVLNIFMNCNENLGDSIDYAQRKNMNLGDLIYQTLEMMEIYGGEDAFINIKYLCPTYQSVVNSSA